MFHKLKAITAADASALVAHFHDGTTKRYDMAPLFSQEPFSALARVPGLFRQVTVDPGGYGASWNDEIDIDCEELWQNGTPIETPFSDLLSFTDATAIWGLNESTLRKAITYGKLRNGLDVMNFGKQWVITRSAMTREYGPPPTVAQPQ